MKRAKRIAVVCMLAAMIIAGGAVSVSASEATSKPAESESVVTVDGDSTETQKPARKAKRQAASATERASDSTADNSTKTQKRTRKSQKQETSNSDLIEIA